MYKQLFRCIPPVPRRPRRCFDSSSTTRSGKYYRTPTGSRSRWRRRGDVRDAQNRALPTVLGTGNGPSALSPRNFAVLGRNPELAPTDKPHVPPDAMRLARRNGSFLGVTVSGSWHPVMAAYRMPIGFSDIRTPCFPTGLTFGTRAAIFRGSLGKSARLHRWMGYIWFVFRAT